MQLTAKGKKLVLHCTYDQRDFPKSLKGRWSRQLKCWTFDPAIMTYKAILDEAHYRRIDLLVDERLVKHFDQKLQQINDTKLSCKLKTEPREYQKHLTKFSVQKRKSFNLSEVGTGKSKCAIDFVSHLYHLGEVNKVLVVTPADIKYNFFSQVKEHSYFDASIIDGTLEQRIDTIKRSNTIFDITNYEILDKLEKQIIKKGYDAIIYDEIHLCKNPSAIRSKAAFSISKDVKYKLGLSGTLVPNEYKDIFMPFKIIDSSIFGTNYSLFKSRYFIMGGYMNYQIVRYQNTEEIKRLIANSCVRVNLDDVVDLPPIINDKKIILPQKDTSRVYKKAKDDMVIEIENEERPILNSLTKIIRLMQITSGFVVDSDEKKVNIGNEKLNMLHHLLESVPGKIIVYCRFTHTIDRVEELCNSLKISNYVFDGRTKDNSLYEKYNNDDTRVWICQKQKAKGYSIPNAKVAVFYDLDYSKLDFDQCKGRNRRAKGSETGSCVYIYLIMKGTIDEVVFKTLKKKDFTAQDALEYVKGAN